MFRTVPLSIIRSFSLYTQQWYMLYRFADSLQAATCQHTCVTYIGLQSNRVPLGFRLIFWNSFMM